MATTEQESHAGTMDYKMDGREVNQMKVEELKAELDNRGLKKSGIKKELQIRLIKHLITFPDNSGTSDIQSSSTNIDQDASSKELSSQDESRGSITDKVSNDCEDDKELHQSQNSEPKVTKKHEAELEDGEITGEKKEIIEEKTEEKSEEKSEEKIKEKKDQKSNSEKKRRISLSRQTSNTTIPSSGSRKRKWNSTSGKSKSSVVISTGSLKGLIPGVQLASTPALEAVMDLDDDKEDEETTEKGKDEEKHESEMEDNDSKQEEKTSNKRTRIVHVEESKKVRLSKTTEVAQTEHIEMDVSQEPSTEDMATGPSVSRNEDLSSTPSSETNFKAKRAVSPPRLPPSEVIHVMNLVRPFTQNQLNQLLSQYGALAEGGFWINKIKSHCYVTYSSVDDAKSARDELHGQRWPTTSPRTLRVDFGDEEQMSEDTEGVLGKKKEETVQKEIIKEENKENIKEKEKVKEKEKGREKEKVREKEKGRETRKQRERKDQKPKEEPSPTAANLLDKLFRKTTALPCIYWLPLTKEQIMRKETEREERRKQRQQTVEEEEKRTDDRLKGREKERDTEKEKAREITRGKFQEGKPSRDNRVTSPAPRPRGSDRRSPDVKTRSRSRSKGLESRRDNRRK